MKKAIRLLGLGLISLALASCGNNSSSQAGDVSSASSQTQGSSESVSEVSTIDVYKNYLEKQGDFYVLSTTVSATKNGETYYSKSVRQSLYVGSGDNAGEVILYVNGTIKTMVGFDSNLATKVENIDYFKTATNTYTKNDGGTYTMTAETNTGLNPFKFAYDFDAASDLTVNEGKIEATVTGKVATDEKLKAFFGSEELAGATDMAFMVTMQKTDGLVENMNFAYNDNGYAVKVTNEYSNVNNVITLPTIQ